MRLLVTGGAGYIGSHFVKRAMRSGHEPVVYDNLTEGHRWAVLTERFVEAGLSDHETLLRVMRDEGIEAVVHFAANAYVGESMQDPSKYFNNNYVGTLGLLDAMVEAGVKNIVLSSTCSVYGEPVRMPIVEETPKNPINPYGLSKHFIEETLGWYAHAYGLRYMSLRYFNAAGADAECEIGEVHDPETHLVPLVLYSALGMREHIHVFGNDYPTPDGTCIRDYIHVDDLAEAHVLALGHLAEGGGSMAVNLGTEHGTSVMQVIEAAREVSGRDIPVLMSGRRAGDPPVLVASNRLALDALGWRPRYPDIGQIISHAWDWLLKAKERGYL